MRPLFSYDYPAIARNTAGKVGYALYCGLSFALAAVLWTCWLVDVIALHLLVPKGRRDLPD